jgi:hypothetical protein
MFTQNSQARLAAVCIAILSFVFASARPVAADWTTWRTIDNESATGTLARVAFTEASKSAADNAAVYTTCGGSAWSPRLATDVAFSLCDVACLAGLPMFYPQAIAALRLAKHQKLLTNKKQCKTVAGDASKLAELLYKAQFGESAGIAAKVVAGSCGKCACDAVF